MDLLSLDWQLARSDLDHVLAFWRYGAKRHAFLTRDYGDACDYLNWLLGRIDASGYEQSVAAQMRMLGESGRVLPVWVRGHCLGLMRPLLLGDRADIEAADPPFLIAFGGDDPCATPQVPVLAAAREPLVGLVRRLHDAGHVDKRGWRKFRCERQSGPLDRLLTQLRRGRVTTFSSDLECELLMAFRNYAPLRRRRAA